MTEPRFSCELMRSSWENIFRVLKWCAPMTIRPEAEKGYEAQAGERWSLGGFWAQVQELQRQVDEAKGVYEWLGENGFGRAMRIGKGNPCIGFACSECGVEIVEGDIVSLSVLGPASEEDERLMKGEDNYNARALLMHADCMERRARGVRFVEQDEGK